MSREFDFPHADTSFFAAVAKRILSNPLPDETASSRMKQIAFMGVLYQIKVSGCEPTINLIMDVTGLPRASMTKFMEPLLLRQMIRERTTLNVVGKGRAYILDIHEDFLSTLNPFTRTF